ncbi:MAG: ATPase, T2SS/T4P/T4SS family, partial [Pontimonas sp.]|nr:ATPase, T2SS/T4P/T4SS family [Pontimonas sp.]
MLTVFGGTAPTLDDLVLDPSLEEVWINGPDQVFVAESGVSRAVPISLSAMEIRGFVERVLRQTGRRVDVSSPFVDASLPDGSRLHVVIPDITKAHWSVNIRKFSQSLRGLGDLVDVGVLSLESAHYLRGAVAGGKSVLVSG